MGIRTPNARERARATGMGGYLEGLGLTERQLFDATGNIFDKDAVKVRARCGVECWIQGRLERHSYPSWESIRTQYHAIKEWVKGQGIIPPETPYPCDLASILRGEPGHTDGRKTTTGACP